MLFQYRLLKTHLEILWGYICCGCSTKEEHSEGVYIGCYGYSSCNRQPEVVIIFQNKRNSAQSMVVTNSKPHGLVAKMSKKMCINKRVIVFSLEFDF